MIFNLQEIALPTFPIIIKVQISSLCNVKIPPFKSVNDQSYIQYPISQFSNGYYYDIYSDDSRIQKVGFLATQTEKLVERKLYKDFHHLAANLCHIYLMIF